MPVVDLRAGPIDAGERNRETLEELRAIIRSALADSIEDFEQCSSGLASVLNISGEIAPTNALAIRLEG